MGFQRVKHRFEFRLCVAQITVFYQLTEPPITGMPSRCFLLLLAFVQLGA
jgi:hypothetical protein